MLEFAISPSDIATDVAFNPGLIAGAAALLLTMWLAIRPVPG